MKTGIATQRDLKHFTSSFNEDGYKTMTLMCFGETAEHITTFRHGCLMMIISPRLLKVTDERPPAFSVDAKTQIHLIGYSRDFHVCEGKSINSKGMDQKCRNFMNKTHQWVCGRH